MPLFRGATQLCVASAAHFFGLEARAPGKLGLQPYSFLLLYAHNRRTQITSIAVASSLNRVLGKIFPSDAGVMAGPSSYLVGPDQIGVTVKHGIWSSKGVGGLNQLRIMAC